MSRNIRLNSVMDIVPRTGLSRSTIYEELGSGRLQSVKVGRRRLIAESQLTEYVNGLIESAAQTKPAL